MLTSIVAMSASLNLFASTSTFNLAKILPVWLMPLTLLCFFTPFSNSSPYGLQFHALTTNHFDSFDLVTQSLFTNAKYSSFLPFSVHWLTAFSYWYTRLVKCFSTIKTLHDNNVSFIHFIPCQQYLFPPSTSFCQLLDYNLVYAAHPQNTCQMRHLHVKFQSHSHCYFDFCFVLFHYDEICGDRCHNTQRHHL